MKKALLFSVAFLFFLNTISCSMDGTAGTVVDPKEKPVLGNESAPVVIDVYSDYECPACGYFENVVFPQIKTNLINTGKVRFIFHDFPLPGHSDSLPAAISSYCAMDQGKYWEMHQILFENQQRLSPAAIKGYAKNIGLDENEFATCLNSNKYKGYVLSLFEEGNTKNISATPTIFVNGNKINTPTVPSFEEINTIVQSL